MHPRLKKNRLKSSRKKRNNKCAKSCNSLAFVPFNDLHTSQLLRGIPED